MTTYHRLLFDSDREDLLSIARYEMAGFDITSFWKGISVNKSLIAPVKLYVGDSKTPTAPDLMGNPMSWYIVSDRLIKMLDISNDDKCECIRAPIYTMKGDPVNGYQIINPLYIIDCLDWNKSKVSRNPSGTIMSIGHFAITRSKVPTTVKIFRPEGFRKAILLSDDAANKTRFKSVAGLAFLRCETVEVGSDGIMT